MNRLALFVVGTLVCLLLLTGSAAAKMVTVTLSSDSVAFGDETVGSSSSPQVETLRLSCSAPCNFSPVIASSNPAFAAASGCPTTTSADFGSDATCPISLSFTPAALVPVGGTLSTGSGAPTAKSERQWSDRAATFPRQVQEEEAPLRPGREEVQKEEAETLAAEFQEASKRARQDSNLDLRFPSPRESGTNR